MWWKKHKKRRRGGAVVLFFVLWRWNLFCPVCVWTIGDKKCVSLDAKQSLGSRKKRKESEKDGTKKERKERRQRKTTQMSPFRVPSSWCTSSTMQEKVWLRFCVCLSALPNALTVVVHGFQNGFWSFHRFVWIGVCALANNEMVQGIGAAFCSLRSLSYRIEVFSGREGFKRSWVSISTMVFFCCSSKP